MVTVRTLFFLLTAVFHSFFRCEGYTYLEPIMFGDGDCLEDDFVTRHPVGAIWYDKAKCEQLQCIEYNDIRYIQTYGCIKIEQPKGCWLVPGSGNYPDCCPQVQCSRESCKTQPPTIDHGRVKSYSEDHSSVVEYECEEGFSFKDQNSKVECISGEWKGTPPKCQDRCTDDKNLSHSVGATWARRKPCQGYQCKEDSGKFYIQTTNCSPPMDPPEGCWIGKGGLNSYPDCCPRVKCDKREQRGCKDGRATYQVGRIWRGSSCDEFECKEDEHMYYIEYRNCSELHLVNTDDCWIQDPPGGSYPDCCPFIKCINGYTNAIKGVTLDPNW